MIRLTKDQRKALKRVFDRGPVMKKIETNRNLTRVTLLAPHEQVPLTYREFRRRVQPGPGCVMIPWQNMWLGIEPDGYTHS